jgi:hypothetical protein
MLCDMPGLMEDADQLKQMNLQPQRSMDHKKLADNITSHLVELYAWRMKVDQLSPDHCHETPSLESHDPFQRFSITIAWNPQMG